MTSPPADGSTRNHSGRLGSTSARLAVQRAQVTFPFQRPQMIAHRSRGTEPKCPANLAEGWGMTFSADIIANKVQQLLLSFRHRLFHTETSTTRLSGRQLIVSIRAPLTQAGRPANFSEYVSQILVDLRPTRHANYIVRYLFTTLWLVVRVVYQEDNFANLGKFLGVPQIVFHKRLYTMLY